MPAKRSIEQGKTCVLLRLRVQPNAARNRLTCTNDAGVRVSLTAPPVDGAANKALRAYPAKMLGVPRGALEITHGEKSRNKTIGIRGMAEQEIRAMLASVTEREKS